MLNRRHIRLKIMQYLYAAEISDFEDTKEHYKNLLKSIHSIHDLFLLNISLMIEIFKKATTKYKISHDSITGNISELYKSKKFSQNQFLKQVFSNSKILDLIISKSFIDWGIDYKYVNLIYDNIIQSDIYSTYVNNEKKSLNLKRFAPKPREIKRNNEKA